MLKSDFAWMCLALALGMVCACMVGCGPPLISGDITKKTFIAEHEVDDPDITIGDITIPGGTSIVPDAWYITFGKECEDGKYRRRQVKVTERYYDSVKVGDWFNLEWYKEDH